MAKKAPVAANRGEIKSGNSENLILDLYYGSAEKTEQRSAWVNDTYRAPYNPDDLYQKTGDYSVFEEMRLDDQISVCMQLKKDLILGSGWDIVTEKEGDTELADELVVRLDEDPERALEDELDDYIDTMYSYGFAVAEKRFSQRPDNSLTFRSLTTRHPNSWLLHTDVFGNITKFEQHGSEKDIDVNPKSLMYATVGNSLKGPYGRADLRSAHNAWFVKRHIVRFYSIFLEKAASPIPVAKYDSSIPDDKVTKLASIIKNFQTKTSITIPKEIEIDFLESPNNGEVYTKGINLFNMFIGRALLVPDLLGFTGEGSMKGGSQALGREQVEIFFKHINRRRRTLERLINRHIVQPLVVYNHGFQDLYPKFKLKPISEDQATKYAEIFIQAMQGNMYKPTEDEINHFRSLIKFPEGEVEFNEVPSGSAGGFPFGPGPQPPEEQNNPPKPEPGPEDMAKEDDALKTYALDVPETERYAETPGTYSKKVNFEELKAQLVADESAVVNELAPVVRVIFDDLFEQMRKKKIVNGVDSKPERIGTIKLRKLKDLQRGLKKQFTASYQKHRQIARNELFKQQFTIDIPDEKYLKWLDDETFEFVGAWAYRVQEQAAVEMRNAIKDGRNIESAISIIDEQGLPDSITSIRRYSRTKGTEIQNRARYREYNESGIVEAVQYSAVMDGRTTNICAGLHGKIFKANEFNYMPPNHFNCRSTIIPITIFEDFEPSTSVNKSIEVVDQTKPGGKAQRRQVKDADLSINDFVKKHGGRGFVDKSGLGNIPDNEKKTVVKK